MGVEVIFILFFIPFYRSGVLSPDGTFIYLFIFYFKGLNALFIYLFILDFGFFSFLFLFYFFKF